jgi:acetyl-CoA decarbonylase/synthase complex subunit gamma
VLALGAWHVSLGGVFASGLHAAAWAFLVPTVASFVVMTFTGSSTFTSLSGVLREMRFAVPLQIGGGFVGLGLWLAGLFVGVAQ